MAPETAAVESVLLREVGAEGALPEPVREALERLLDELLGSLAGLGPRPTDGLTLRRDGVDSCGFWAVGKAHLLEVPYEEPVWAEFVFNRARDAIVSGRVLFGIRDDALTGVRRTTLEDMLLGYPREAVDRIPWRHEFTRSTSGWTQVAALDLP